MKPRTTQIISKNVFKVKVLQKKLNLNQSLLVTSQCLHLIRLVWRHQYWHFLEHLNHIGVSKPCCCALFSSCSKDCSTDLNSLFSEVRIHRSLITWVSGRRQERYYWKTHFFGFVGTYPTRIHLSWFKNSPFHSSKSSKTISLSPI